MFLGLSVGSISDRFFYSRKCLYQIRVREVHTAFWNGCWYLHVGLLIPLSIHIDVLPFLCYHFSHLSLYILSRNDSISCFKLFIEYDLVCIFCPSFSDRKRRWCWFNKSDRSTNPYLVVPCRYPYILKHISHFSLPPPEEVTPSSSQSFNLFWC